MSPDLTDENFRGKLSACVKSGIIYDRWEKVLAELFLAMHPWLSPKELCVCKWITYTIWDLDTKHAFYEEVIMRIVSNHPELFTTQKELSDTIDGLCKRECVICSEGRTEWGLLLGFVKIFELWRVETCRFLGFPDAVREEAIAAMGECLEQELNGFLRP